MNASLTDRTLHETIHISVPPERVWRVVSDVRRTGEWSPECTRVILFGRVRTGTLMLGVNRHRAVWWVTLSRITRADPEREIAWRVLTNRAVWSYRITPIDDGCEVRQTRETPNGVSGFARWFTRVFLGGQATHDDELELGMRGGLVQIKALAER
jgi:uncharacterized protein YndB with AHSA1/START domain